MKKILSSVSALSTGATLRDKPVLVSKPDSLLMQLGDLSTDGAIQLDTMLPFLMEKQFERFVAQEGDLIFRGRGAGIAVSVMCKTELPIIVTSPLIIIRPDHKKVDSHYLAWTLTTNDARRHYAYYLQGSSIIGIGIRDLETIEIQLPSVAVQRKIGKCRNLLLREKQLMSSYYTTRLKLIDAFINDSILQEKTT